MFNDVFSGSKEELSSYLSLFPGYKMTLIEQIKKDQLTARKNRDAVATSLLTVLMSEALMVAKNDGREAPTDEEVVASVRKFLKGNAEVQLHAKDEALDIAKREAELLNGYLPKQLTEVELGGIITSLNEPNMGKIMAHLKANYTGQYDGALASKVVKKVLAS